MTREGFGIMVAATFIGFGAAWLAIVIIYAQNGDIDAIIAFAVVGGFALIERIIFSLDVLFLPYQCIANKFEVHKGDYVYTRVRLMSSINLLMIVTLFAFLYFWRHHGKRE